MSRLDGLKLKYEETGQKLTDPEVIADVKQFVQLNKEYKELEPIIETSERYRTALANLAEAKDILANDKDEETCCACTPNTSNRRAGATK